MVTPDRPSIERAIIRLTRWQSSLNREPEVIHPRLDPPYKIGECADDVGALLDEYFALRSRFLEQQKELEALQERIVDLLAPRAET